MNSESVWATVDPRATGRSQVDRADHQCGYGEDPAGAPSEHAHPRVSIGMPVYNCEATVGTAIAAVLAQSFTDFELIISDNASTDGTRALCDHAAMGDPRIRVIHQPRNLGAIANFATVLSAGRAPFFVFAAGDDWMEPDFIEETLLALKEVPDAVGCAPRTTIHFSSGRSKEAYGSKAIRGPGWWRVARFLIRPADNSRFYGLFRTEVLRSAYLNGHRFHALDWAISALTLTRGHHLQSRSIILHRQGSEPGKYYRDLGRNGQRRVERWFPVARMSAAVLKRLNYVHMPLVVPVLLVLNLQKSVECFWASVREKFRG